jgi:hypothetical protein
MEHHNKELNLDETKQYLLEMINSNDVEFLKD